MAANPNNTLSSSAYSMDYDSNGNYQSDTYGIETLGRRMVDGNYIDGSWQISVFVLDLNMTVTIRVRGEFTLGDLMHRTAEATGRKQDWSRHSIWWPTKKQWLLKTKRTLDQCRVQSDAGLQFRPVQGDLCIILPSQYSVIFRVSYAARVLNVVQHICKELNIRHPEEFSLSVQLTAEHMKTNKPLPYHYQAAGSNLAPVDPKAEHAKIKQLPNADPLPSSPYATLQSGAGMTLAKLRSFDDYDNPHNSDQPDYSDFRLRCSAKSVFSKQCLMRPKNLAQKARLNSGWLDSSRSLLEQDIAPPDSAHANGHQPAGVDKPPTLYLTLKYFAIYDLNPKYDAFRIHQLYEQARWSLLSGQFDCTEAEAVAFAAYQLQSEIQTASSSDVNAQTLNRSGGQPYSMPGTMLRQGSYSPVSHSYCATSPTHPADRCGDTYRSPTGGSGYRMNQVTPVTDDLDEMLAEMEQSCGVADELHSTTRQLRSTGSSGLPQPPAFGALRSHDPSLDTDVIPTLKANVGVIRERKLSLGQRFKPMCAVITEGNLYLYGSRGEVPPPQPVAIYLLRGNTVTSAVKAHKRYDIRLKVQPVTNGKDRHHQRDEVLLRFDTSDLYARWLAAFRLGAEGKTLASRVAYDKELEAIVDQLRLMENAAVTGSNVNHDYYLAASPTDTNKLLGDLTDFCNEKLIGKVKLMRSQILQAHGHLVGLSSVNAKLQYIEKWQRLNSFGRNLFIVDFKPDAKPAALRSAKSGGAASWFSAKSDDMIAISQSRIELINPANGDVLQSWAYSELKSWTCNWDTTVLQLVFVDETISFTCRSASNKTVHEFIGGYILLGLRNPEKNVTFDERQFYRLTCAPDKRPYS